LAAATFVTSGLLNYSLTTGLAGADLGLAVDVFEGETDFFGLSDLFGCVLTGDLDLT
jgi:hypothetical protein